MSISLVEAVRRAQMQADALAQCLLKENDQLRQQNAKLAAALQEARRIIDSDGRSDRQKQLKPDKTAG
jgi:hypothetical protein